MKTLVLGIVLASALTPIAPALSQTTTRKLTCETTIAVTNGGTLTYKITGSIAVNRAGQPVIPNRRNSNLLMTVQRRNRNGKIQTLLNNVVLQHYEQVAPDADYSQLPFSAGLRGKPNNGQGLYSIPGTLHGLYASFRSLESLPPQFQFQVVHYLSANQWVRSSIDRCRAT
jgi:hypothetical protein